MACIALYLVIRESRLLAQKSDNEVENTDAHVVLYIYKLISKCGSSKSFYFKAFIDFLLDVQHGICWTLHYPAYGNIFSLHWNNLQ